MIAELAIWLAGLAYNYAPECSTADSFPQQLGCLYLVKETRAAGMHQVEHIVLELSYRESRWTPGRVNRKTGCAGMLQAAPQYWCPNRRADGCHLTRAGLLALSTYLGKHPSDQARAICHFRAGRCTEAGYKRSSRILRRAKSRR